MGLRITHFARNTWIAIKAINIIEIWTRRSNHVVLSIEYPQGISFAQNQQKIYLGNSSINFEPNHHRLFIGY